MAPYIGEIRLFAGNFPPAGWAFCDGQLIPISENDALFILLGTTYGGDGQETFALPNLQSRVPIHFGTGPSGNTYDLGEAGGVEQVTLTTQQIPVHNHALLVSNDGGTTTTPEGNLLCSSPSINWYFEGDGDTNLGAASVGPQGGSQPHENTQPFLCVNFIISLFGVFPTQN
jgi:microcystin-dependent protein